MTIEDDKKSLARQDGRGAIMPTLIWLGGGAAAMIAIITVITIVIPLLRSDPPPFVGRENFDALAQNFQQMQQSLQTTAETLRRVNQKQDQQDLDYWNGQVAVAEARLKVSPNDELARGMLRVARDQIEMITARIQSNQTPSR